MTESPEFQLEHWSRDGLDKRRRPSHPVVRTYALSMISRLERLIPLEKSTKLLDVGCGNGFFTVQFDKMCETTGIDYSRKMVQLNPCKQTYCMNANDLEFEDSSFDIVFEATTLHHLSDPDRVLKEMRRVSRRYVILHEPNRNNPLMLALALALTSERKVLRFSPRYLKSLAEANGLRTVAAYSNGAIGPNTTPSWLLPLVKPFNFKQPFGMYTTIIAEKR